MVFLPHTYAVILLGRYCGTITEPGLPVVFNLKKWLSAGKFAGNLRNAQHILSCMGKVRETTRAVRGLIVFQNNI